MLYNQLQAFSGEDFKLNDFITIHSPSLREIRSYGERGDTQYLNMVRNLTATPTDLKVLLDDKGIDYTKIQDFELFCTIIRFMYPPDKLSILISGVDFTTLDYRFNALRNANVLYDYETGMIFDEYTYILMTEYIRKMHHLKKNFEAPANESTRKALIEDARELMLYNQNKEEKSPFIPMISTLVNTAGFKYNYDTVWDVKLVHFLDAAARFSHTQNVSLLLQSGYSGFGINLKDVKDKDNLDYFKDL